MLKLPILKRHTNESQTARLLRLFKQRGELTNVELNRLIGFRYGARIHELRHEGHKITSVHDKGSVWRFVYHGTV